MSPNESMSIAIGTALAGCPSHGSVRAELPHTALTLDADDRTAHRDTDARDAADGEVSFPSRPADVRETQKVERLGRAIATLRSAFGRVASELDQPRFLRMQFQAELGEPLPQRR